MRPTSLLPAFLLSCAIPQPPAERTIHPTPVTLTTSDALNLAAHWFPADTTAGDRPALVLLHGGRQRKERWLESGFLAELAPDNYHYLAIDLRHHGASDPAPDQLRDPRKARADIEAALHWLRQQPGVDHKRIALVGSSYGANLAAAGCLDRAFSARALLCFSATRMAHRFARKPEPLTTPGLFLACTEEAPRYEAEATALQFAESSTATAKIYPGPYHALWMFENIQECRPVVRRFLRQHLQH